MAGRSGIVTGAGRGLGRAIALCLARSGAQVAVFDIDAATAQETAQLVEDSGSKAIAVPVDISVEEDVEQGIAAAVDAFGQLSFACNNAVGEVVREPLVEMTLDVTRRMVDIALVGTALCLKHELRHLLQGVGDRSIVNISSTAPLRGENGCGIYAACKAGIEGMTRVAANESGSNGVRVNALACGGMLTPALEAWLDSMPGSRELVESRLALGRIAPPEDVADSALFLCSSLARYITGTTLIADGGGMLHTSVFKGLDRSE